MVVDIQPRIRDSVGALRVVVEVVVVVVETVVVVTVGTALGL